VKKIFLALKESLVNIFISYRTLFLRELGIASGCKSHLNAVGIVIIPCEPEREDKS
jgi:hypothetical protein